MKNCVGCNNSKDVYYGESGIVIFEICACKLLPNNMTVDRFNPANWCPLIKK